MKYLLFELGADCYAVPVEAVSQIVELQAVAPIPRAPEALRGVMNLRGRIVPVVDLRLVLGVDAGQVEFQTCCVVLEAMGGLGVVVDRVLEVAEIAPEAVSAAPPHVTAFVKTEYLLGVSRVGERVAIIIDAVRALSPQELRLLRDLEGTRG